MEITLTIHITPNPNNGSFNVIYTLPNGLKKYYIYVYNVLGQLVVKVSGNGGFVGEYHKVFNLNVASGIYFAQIIHNNKRRLVKFVVIN